jgi:hypothetical protein
MIQSGDRKYRKVRPGASFVVSGAGHPSDT